MYGLPQPSHGDHGDGPVVIGSLVVYEGSLTEAWGRYRVAAIAERP
ncbi:hypothetical protein Lesp02_03080 [Lentzea sp. NBRC 105346]|nr:hypothetical protein Lesp02_03080 [Lentzea sp. NBRC 105346]